MLKYFFFCFFLLSLASANFTTLTKTVSSCSCTDCCFKENTQIQFTLNQNNVSYSGTLRGSCNGIISSTDNCAMWLYNAPTSTDPERFYFQCNVLGLTGTSNSALLKNNQSDWTLGWTQGTNQCLLTTTSSNGKIIELGMKLFIGMMALLMIFN